MARNKSSGASWSPVHYSAQFLLYVTVRLHRLQLETSHMDVNTTKKAGVFTRSTPRVNAGQFTEGGMLRSGIKIETSNHAITLPSNFDNTQSQKAVAVTIADMVQGVTSMMGDQLKQCEQGMVGSAH